MLSSIEYNGYTIVIFPTGKCMVHKGTGSIPPSGEFVHEAENQILAAKWINVQTTYDSIMQNINGPVN
jgi:hypothetical protein